ncbi:DUF4430 domain-containing protein [Enhygromyxa salina]|nr:DUF4430 domain-containing protein [Enhygromyxa salina]
MINETYDSFISRGGETASPFHYCQFNINGTPANHSVDQVMVKAGDEISFEFERYTLDHHRSTLLESKHERQLR